jgi:chromosome partitioning protein
MPVIAIANPKGGAGKSTVSLVLATILAEHGASVALLDADPNRPLLAWSRGAADKAAPSSESPTTTVHVIGDVTEASVVRAIDAERSLRQFVIVDLEGTASRMVSRAIARADLVLVPMQASAVDAAQAARAIALVREEEEVLQRRIPVRILLTRTNPAIPTRAERMILDELRAAAIPILKTHLHQRAAYPSMFAFRRTLADLDPKLVNGLPAAIENAEHLAAEIVDVVRGLTQEMAA